jgi:hypothetical protein
MFSVLLDCSQWQHRDAVCGGKAVDLARREVLPPGQGGRDSHG